MGKNFKNGFCKLNKVMRWSLLWRMAENVIALGAVTVYLMMDPSDFLKQVGSILEKFLCFFGTK